MWRDDTRIRPHSATQLSTSSHHVPGGRQDVNSMPQRAPSQTPPVVLNRSRKVRPATAGGDRGSLLLKRRPSTPNTLEDIASLFRHPRSVAANNRQRIPTNVDRRRISLCLSDDQAEEGPPVFPQTVAFMSLLASGHHEPSYNRDLPTGSSEFVRDTHPCLSTGRFARPASAPSHASASQGGTTVGTPVGQPYLWRDVLLRPEQERFFGGRPLSAQNRRCLLPGNHSRPSSAQAVSRISAAPHTPWRSAIAPHHGDDNNVDGDFAAEVTLVNKAYTALLARGECDVHVFADVVEALVLVCGLCAHLDAATHRLSSSPASGTFPLPFSAPWSAISVQCKISKETFVFVVASPSSRVIGSRVFNAMMRVLNGVPCKQLDGLRHCFAVRMANLTIRSASLRLSFTDDVPLHEMCRIEDEVPEDFAPNNNDPTVPDADTLLELPTASCLASSPSPHESAALDTVRSSSTSTRHIHELETVDFQEIRDECSMESAAFSPNNRSTTSITRSTPTVSGSPNRQRSMASGTGSVRAFRVRSNRSLRGFGDRTPSTATSWDDNGQRCQTGERSGVATTMYVRDSQKMVAAAASLRRLSAESSPLGVLEHCTGYHGHPVSRHPSLRRLRSSVRFMSGLFQRAPIRKRVALVIAVSTFEDTSLPCCPQIRSDAAELVLNLELECKFDRVVLLSSERPDHPDAVPSMRNIRKAADAIVATFLVEGEPDPSICVFVLSRGAVVSPGAIPGIGPRSCCLVPFPSVAYSSAAVQAQQPAPGVKIALLETANTQKLRSVDLLTPEMFFELFQVNGRLCSPTAVYFDVWPCTLPSGVVRPQCEDCGVCGWYSPLAVETDFTSISRRGVCGIGTHYLLKLLRGAVLRGAAKQPPNEGRPSVHHRVLRHVETGLALFHAHVHHYMVERLQRRNCGVLFSSIVHINDAAESASTNLGHPTRMDSTEEAPNAGAGAVMKAYPPFQLHCLAARMQLPLNAVAHPTDGVDVQGVLHRAAEVLLVREEAVRSTFAMEITSPLVLLNPIHPLGLVNVEEPLQFPEYAALIESTLAALFGTSHKHTAEPPYVQRCVANRYMGPVIQFAPPGEASEVVPKLIECAEILRDVVSATDPLSEIDVEVCVSTLTAAIRRASVVAPLTCPTAVPPTQLWDLDTLSTIGLGLEIRAVSLTVNVQLSINDRCASKVSRAMRMGSLRSLGMVTSLEREGASTGTTSAQPT